MNDENQGSRDNQNQKKYHFFYLIANNFIKFTLKFNFEFKLKFVINIIQGKIN